MGNFNFCPGLTGSKLHFRFGHQIRQCKALRIRVRRASGAGYSFHQRNHHFLMKIPGLEDNQICPGGELVSLHCE
jgi:hypothetical protein